MNRTVTIQLHYCSREEEQELISYLENQCWQFNENSSQRLERLQDEFDDLLTSDPDFNYEENEFNDWYKDYNNEE